MPLSSFFRKRVREKDYPKLQKSLRESRIARPVHEYVAQSGLYSVILGVVVASSCYFGLYFLLGLSMLYSVGLSAAAGLGLGFGSYYLFLYYPRLKATNRKKNIRDMLPHATAYMLALSKGGFEPIEIFDSLSDQEEYGEIAREAGAIVRNSKILGYSPTEAIEDVADSTPSQEFGDFLTSLSSVIETGASITDFLYRRSDRYYEEAEENQEENLEFLGVLSEVYVAGLGLGPIFGIVILIVLGMMGNFMSNILYLIVYLLIPLGTGAFILLLDMQSRTRFGENTASGSGSSEESFLSSMNGKIKNSREKLSSVKGIIASPFNVLWASVPVGAAVSVLLFYYTGIRIESVITFFAMISLSPLAVFFEMKRRKEERMINIAPDFLNSFSDSLSSGLSPSKALFSLDPGRYGEIKSEIERMRRDIEWGTSVPEAFQRSADRMEAGIISRIMSLVKKSSEVASDISGILKVLAEDVSTERSLQQERKRVTTTYAIIVFLTFGIFLLTAYSLSSSIIPLMTKMSEAKTGAGQQALSFQVGGIAPSTIKRIFFQASLLQGFSSGLVAGMMQTGRLSAGLKYSMVMLGVAWAFFTLLGI